jgi:hypothetical protein
MKNPLIIMAPIKQSQICKLKRVLPVILALALILSLALSGCGKPSSEPGEEQIAASTIAAMGKAKSYQLDTYMTENYIVVEKSSPSITADLWRWTSHRLVDMSKQEMHLAMDSREAVGTAVTPYTFERYLIGGWVYYAQSSPYTGGTTNPWIKTKLDEQSNITWSDETQLNPQIELLKTSGDIRFAGTENIDGSDCYIIELSPSAEAATDWVLSQEQYSGLSMGWFRMPMERSREIYIKAFQNGWIKLWIEKDNYLILKVNISLLFDGVPGNILRSDTGLDIAPGQENSTDVGFEHIIRDFNGQWEFSNYNKPVHIQLPQEALNAVESGG